jgi:hypothetical protein
MTSSVGERRACNRNAVVVADDAASAGMPTLATMVGVPLPTFQSDDPTNGPACWTNVVMY